jgi:hypothetical protein
LFQHGLRNGIGLFLPYDQAIDAVVRSANRTRLLVSGGERAGDDAMLDKARQSMEVGATGLIFGRNVWQREGAMNSPRYPPTGLLVRYRRPHTSHPTWVICCACRACRLPERQSSGPSRPGSRVWMGNRASQAEATSYQLIAFPGLCPACPSGRDVGISAGSGCRPLMTSAP